LGWWKGFIPTRELNANSEEDLMKKANDSLIDGSLDSGMGYESLIGAILDITKITTIVIDDKEFINKEYSIKTIGTLNDEEIDFLESCL